MTESDTKLAEKLLGNDGLLSKVYDDISPPVREVGGVLSDVVKAARLLTAPVQYLAHIQDKLSRYIQDLDNSIPTEDKVT
ncbi:MAG: hypothetical protein GY808_00050, partial [Gammaproteobacteria bacterium]|nr:hypothetical protein [Gammaproteobacteria bacterium]